MYENERKMVDLQGDTAEQFEEYTEYKIGRVTYRVKAVYEGERDAIDSLSALMLRSLEEEKAD